jgi:RND family efflux transporter MFP subunit
MSEWKQARLPDSVMPEPVVAPAIPEKETRSGGHAASQWLRGRRFRVVAVAALALGLGSHYLGRRNSTGTAWGGDEAPPITATVVAGPFTQEVVERGEVESSSNVEVRSEVSGRGIAGATIIQIVEEGTYVNKGDFLVKLDDSSLQSDLVQQQIGCNTSRALVIEAEAEVESAKLARREYESGTFRQAEQGMESEEFVAKENLRRAEEYLRYSEKLASRGYVTEVQIEADRFAVEKARKELESARTKLEVLRNFTKLKEINKLNADIQTAEARLASRRNTHNLDNDKLKLIEEQIVRCVIKAPTSGQVVYANDSRNNSTGEPLIGEGKMVRERQKIVHLPDPKRMRVLARVNESRIDRVKDGMAVRIKTDALPGLALEGTVRGVSEYPLPPVNSYNPLKEYAVEVEIHDPPEGLRSGMTAQVAIQIETRDEALLVPLQAVIQRDSRFFCIVLSDGKRIEAREVTVGLANEKSVVVESGLQAGEQVLLAPQNYEDQVSLPAAANPNVNAPVKPRPAAPVDATQAAAKIGEAAPRIAAASARKKKKDKATEAPDGALAQP